ncbi:MAG: NAD-dependent epimerase/dehydratase family protein [Gammaproteobacteria bacterium]|nr:NAD-dependent epimerase/dehydratase family protein [Gammaproteobacteria bacterium]
MRYLVSGANGFIGRALCGLLMERGCRVRALVRRETPGPWHEQICCDLARDSIPSEICRDIDGVFHLAGIAHVRAHASDDDPLYQRVNVDGARLLLDAAESAGVRRFVFFSSVKAAADPGEHCVDEGWDAPPTDAYGRSKLSAERLVLRRAERGMHVSVLRPTLVYGQGVKGNLRRMIDAVAAGRFPPLPDTHNRRSMVSLSDLAEAAWLAMTLDAAKGRVYIVSDGVDYSTHAIHLAIRTALGRPAPSWSFPLWLLTAGARLGDLLEHSTRRPMSFSSAALARLCGSACYRSDRLRAELGWSPRATFNDVVGEMLEAATERTDERRWLAESRRQDTTD